MLVLVVVVVPVVAQPVGSCPCPAAPRGSAPLLAAGTRQRPPSPACRRAPGRGEARRCSAHSRRAMKRIMKRIWRFPWSRRAREGPVSSGSSGGDELREEGRDELRLGEAIKESKSSGGEVGKDKGFKLDSSF